MKTILLASALLLSCLSVAGCELIAAGVIGAAVVQNQRRHCSYDWRGCRYYYAHKKEHR